MPTRNPPDLLQFDSCAIGLELLIDRSNNHIRLLFLHLDLSSLSFIALTSIMTNDLKDFTFNRPLFIMNFNQCYVSMLINKVNLVREHLI